jgi:hypothetical protein
VNLGKRGGEVGVDVAPLLPRQGGQRVVVEDAAFDPFHEIEGGSDDGGVFFIEKNLRHLDRCGDQRGLYPILAVDRMGRWKDLAVGPPTHHQPPIVVGQEVGRVGLASADPLDPQRAAQAMQPRPKPVVEPSGVEVVGIGRV